MKEESSTIRTLNLAASMLTPRKGSRDSANGYIINNKLKTFPVRNDPKVIAKSMKQESAILSAYRVTLS